MALTMLPVSTVSQTRSGYLEKSEKDLDAIKRWTLPGESLLAEQRGNIAIILLVPTSSSILEQNLDGHIKGFGYLFLPASALFFVAFIL